MKKFLALFLSLLTLFSCAPLAMAAEDDLKLIFATDVHFSQRDSGKPVTNSTVENPFGHTISNGKMLIESAAILDAFLKEAAESDADYIVLTGDISDNGETDNVDGIVQRLEQFEQESGKTILACMGNHETYHLSATNSYISGGLTGVDFRECYKNLGYDKALAIDEASASYTVDLNSKYRLIAIDTNVMDARLVNWIREQAESAKADGKCLISATHMSLFAHYKVETLGHGSVIDPALGLPDLFIDYGIKFNFSGHTHDLDTAAYTNKKGVVYDITNGALTTYPANYKTAVFTNRRVTIGTRYIDKVDTALVPEGIAKEAMDLMENDFRAYAKTMFLSGAQSEIGKYIRADYLCNLAGLDGNRDGDVIQLIQALVPRLNEAIRMPLYGESSLSTLAKKNGFPLPKSSYTTLFDVIAEVYCAHCAGNEDCSVYTPVGKLAMNGLATALAYALDGLSKEDFRTVINWALDTFNLPVEISEKLRDIAAGALDKYDAIEYAVVYIASPIIDDFLRDKSPDDETSVFTPYGKNDLTRYTMQLKLMEFFPMLRLVLRMLTALLKLPLTLL